MSTAAASAAAASGSRLPKRINLYVAIAVLALLALLPLFFDPLSNFIDDMVLALAFVVMALGLNIVVGFAGLLDLGYVAFFAFGAYTVGWLASGHFAAINDEKGLHVLAGDFLSQAPGVHLNFIFVALAAILITAFAGMVIGLPTLRLRGDYIAIVTLAFGEIIYRFAVNGDQITIGNEEDGLYKLTNGRQAISNVDPIDLPGLAAFDGAFSLRGWYWFALAMVAVVLFINFRLRDSRLGRAWIALREDEVAAASMGVPLVKTKLLAYATGAALGGLAGAFLGSYFTSVNANQFQFGFSIFILAMVILGGLGSIWGVVIGAVVITFLNYRLIPDVFNKAAADLDLGFAPSDVNFGIFGLIIIVLMILRPEGLLPERRRKIELREGVGVDDAIAAPSMASPSVSQSVGEQGGVSTKKEIT